MRQDRTIPPPSGGDVLAMIAPACVWAAHFIVLYALISAACAPRVLIGAGGLILWGAIATAVALALALAPLLRRGPAGALRLATWTMAGISAAAILADAAIFLWFDGCGG